ncbi:MAG: class I mannose-6-phosphate isomerase [Proteobacteria bacterium]|nr:class I mannose-6-phosphate isomerase [Pseudomonadota bacterium]
MSELPILTFQPLLKETVWGGRRLEDLMDRNLPEGRPIGESWEIVDLPADQSIVSGGKLNGWNLQNLRIEFEKELLGGVSLLEGRFPLLFKFIDAQKTLSVQVHPGEEACARLGGGARPKTEAWYVIDCEPGAALYVGLCEGVNKNTLKEAIEAGTVEQLLHKLLVKPGDFVFLPAGTIHAIGEGIVLAEVHQASDTTYRVFDWNRVGLDGKPRQLHVSEALESIDFSTFGPPNFDSPASGRPGIVCSNFVIEETILSDGEETTLEGAGPLMIMGIRGDGSIEVRADDDTSSIKRGLTGLVPAKRAGSVQLKSRGQNTVLAVRIPI